MNLEKRTCFPRFTLSCFLGFTLSWYAVQGTFGCCVEGHGLMRTIGEDGLKVVLDDLSGLFQP